MILTALSTAAFGQINLSDSTVQVVSYWDIGEKQSYSISLHEIKLTGTDTTSNEIMTYDVDVTVVDSAAHSYVIEWFYHDYKTNSPNEIIQKVTALSEDLKVLIETDELGTIQGIKNWEEVSAYMKKAIGQVRNDFKDVSQLEQLFTQIEMMYTSRQGIEATAIQDVQQFHHFHGGKYLLGERLEFPLQVPNLYNPDSPLDAKGTLYLDEINPDDNNFIIRSSQEVDADQLTNTAFDYLVSMAESLGTSAPKKEEIGKLFNETATASRIHGSGWVIYSIQTTTVTGQGVTNIKERILEIK